MTWQPRTPEIGIPFDPRELELYERDDPTSQYYAVRWPLRAGRGRYGEFPLVVVREHYRRLGYTVWASEPELPDDTGFILVSYPGKRGDHHPAFVRMEQMFGKTTVAELNGRADEAKRLQTDGRGGGDPDLFVFRDTERFFVEVKWRDKISEKQIVAFPIIEQVCNVEVMIARISSVKP